MFFGVARVPLDALAAAAALLFAYRLREANIDLIPNVQLLEPAHTLPLMSQYLLMFVLPSIIVVIVLAAVLGLYTLRLTLSAWTEIGKILLVAVLWLICVTAWYFLVLRTLFYSRVLLFQATFFLAFFLTLLRMSLLLLQRSLLREGIGKLLVVSVGSRALASPAKDTLLHEPHYHYLGHLETLENLKRFERKQRLDLVIQTDPNPGSEETIALINECRSHHIGYGFLPPVLAEVPHQLQVERLGLLPLIRFQPTPLDGWGHIAKRTFDLLASALLLVLLSPIFALIAIAIILDTGTPVLYVSMRIGAHGRRRIRAYKFRTMVRDADQRKEEFRELSHRTDGPLFKVRNDPRVTRVGRVLRRLSLDELPQLLNVLRGEMSLVGPRPHLPEEVDRYSPEQRRVFAVKPGITGLAQISGRSNLKFEDEVRLDLQYIEDWSLLFDLWILWRTVFTILKREGAD
jgi:exopolysaccharide biosynthesis polyprenyl glycosylphosphotransferase